MSVLPAVAALERLNRMLILASVLLLLAGVAVFVLNVACRYLLQQPLTASADLARYAIIWSALLAAVVLANRRQHLVIDLFRPAGTAGRLLEITVAAGSLCFFLIVAISGTLLLGWTQGQTAPSLQWLPMPLVYSIVPLAGCLMALGACVHLFQLVWEG